MYDVLIASLDSRYCELFTRQLDSVRAFQLVKTFSGANILHKCQLQLISVPAIEQHDKLVNRGFNSALEFCDRMRPFVVCGSPRLSASRIAAIAASTFYRHVYLDLGITWIMDLLGSWV